jgi:hypothetical protein
MANLWHSLEILSTQAALLMEWKQELGDDFVTAWVFLRPTQEQAARTFARTLFPEAADIG